MTPLSQNGQDRVLRREGGSAVYISAGGGGGWPSLLLDLGQHACEAGLVGWAGGRTLSPLSSAPAVQKILMGWRVGLTSSRDTEGKARREPKVTVGCVCCEWITVFPAFFSVRADGREIQPPDLLGQREHMGWDVLGRHHMRCEKSVGFSVRQLHTSPHL